MVAVDETVSVARRLSPRPVDRAPLRRKSPPLRHEIVERSSRSGSRPAASDTRHVIDPRVHPIRASDRQSSFRSYPIRSFEWGGEKLVESRWLGSRLGWLGDNISVHATTCVGCKLGLLFVG